MASKIMQEYIREELEDRNIEMAQSLLQMKLGTLEQIAIASKLPLEKVQELAAQMNQVTA